MNAQPRLDVREAILTRAECVARDTWLYQLTLADPLPFGAGQFVNLQVPGATPRGERSYSVYSDPFDPTRIELAVKLFEGGAASEYLRAARVGDPMRIRGPFGVFTMKEDAASVVFVATATGIAPFMSMLSVAARVGDPRPLTMYFGVRDQGDLFAVEALDALRTRLPGLEYTLCLSRPQPGWSGYVGRVTQLLKERTVVDGAHYYMCGNGAMIEEARDHLKGAGVDRKRLHHEKYY